MKWPKRVWIYTDGASRGNPGPSSLGVHVIDETGHTYAQLAESLGEQTNNFAEYSAVVRGLQLALDNNVCQVILRSDSQLLIRQLKGQYKVKSKSLLPLFKKCQSLLDQFESFQLEHVRRELNTKADELANKALDTLS